MRNRKDEIITQLLNRNTWVTAKNLSIILGISERSIRKHIAAINKNQALNLVESSNLGYKLNVEAYHSSDFQQAKEVLVDSPAKRKVLILSLLLQKESLSIDAILQKLYVSDSTLENDIISLKRFLRDYDLKLVIRKDTLCLSGTEINKRALMKNLLSEENYSMFKIDSDQTLIDKKININELSKVIEKNLIDCDIFLNDYTLQYLVLHVLIVVSRLDQDHTISSGNLAHSEQRPYQEVVEKLSRYLTDKYQLNISEEETLYLEYILQSNIPLVSLQNESEKDEIEEYSKIVRDILIEVEENFVLDLINDDFLAKFAFHIQNLHIRLKNRIFLKSPLKEDVNECYPLIYDISVYIAHQLQKLWGFDIGLSEIDYIAFHIGAYLASSQQSNVKVNCLIYYKKYYDNNLELEKRLQTVFSEEMDICGLRRFDSDEPVLPNIDLVIATSEDYHLYQDFPVPVYLLNPLVNFEDIKKLRAFLTGLKLSKESALLRGHLFQLLKPHLFKRNVYFDSPQQAIQEMCDEVYQLGYVEKDFTKDVLQRESLSSTAFSNQLAIPHALDQSAKHSFFSLILNDQDMDWGTQKVKVICLFCLRKDERKEFNAIFEKIIAVFTSIENIVELQKAASYDDFIQILSKLISELSQS